MARLRSHEEVQAAHPPSLPGARQLGYFLVVVERETLLERKPVPEHPRCIRTEWETANDGLNGEQIFCHQTPPVALESC